MTLNIKKSYINKTKEYLEDLRMKTIKKEILEEEIEILTKKQSLNEEINFNEIGFKSSRSYKGIDDLIVTVETQITSKQAQIEKINHDLRMYNLYSRELTQIEKEILNLRYLSSPKKTSFERISTILKYSKSQVARMHDDTIEKLAFYTFGVEATYE